MQIFAVMVDTVKSAERFETQHSMAKILHGTKAYSLILILSTRKDLLCFKVSIKLNVIPIMLIILKCQLLVHFLKFIFFTCITIFFCFSMFPS